MKKFIIRLAAFMLVAAMTASFAACGNSNSDSTSGADSASTSTSGETAQMVDIPYSKGLSEDGLWEGINMADYVTLPEYKNLTVPAADVTPTEEDIESVRQNLLSGFGEATQITDRAVEDGDLVNIDYVGTVDGVEFTGGNTQGNGTTVTAGSTAYVDDFLTQIIGHKPGETMDVVVTFPEDYNDSTDADGNTVVLAGKEAVFKTTINYIEGETVYPDFDDAFVTENLRESYGWTTAEEANQGIAQQLQDYNKYQYLVDYLLENSTVTEIPETMMSIMLEQEEANLNNVAASNGMTVDYILMFYGYESLDAFREDFKTSSADQIKLQMIYQLIGEKESLIPSDETLKTELGDSYDSSIETYGSPYMHRQLLMSNVTNFLMDNNAIG